MSCTLCHNAMPEGEWCRACGEGMTADARRRELVEPMAGLRLAIRKAHGGPLSTDGPDEREALYAAIQLEREASHAE